MKIDHIGMIVKNLEASLENYTSKLGLEVKGIEEVEVEGSKDRLAFIPVGDTKIELIETSAEKGLAADFLKEHGEGVHHIAILVEGIDKIFNDLKSQGVEFVWDEVIERDPKTKIAFFEAKEFNGILIEMIERS
ncbi:VOC family protein [Thermodesulfobacteriota bacterium]